MGVVVVVAVLVAQIFQKSCSDKRMHQAMPLVEISGAKVCAALSTLLVG